jgi:hypothetical protein
MRHRRTSPAPFALSLSKPVLSRPPQAAAEGGCPSLPAPGERQGFDELSPNGVVYPAVVSGDSNAL